MPNISDDVVKEFLEQVAADDALGQTVADELAVAFGGTKLPKAEHLLQMLSRLTGEEHA